ncbi:hypothetical protein Tsp_10772 [Trichinella spiralis]|uniref:hypothetical protein n=1 Tax=Trichinella spiralis TaxID=6334 RepID=UPI0001EFD4E8|nr:hypothetical protein Tsp_10772 [Trichinella spiralis]
MVSSNIGMEDVLKGRLTSVIIFIQNVAITFAIFQKLMMFSQTVAEYVSLKSVNECALVQDVKFEGVRRVTLCKCDGKHCRWHSATSTLRYANAVAMFLI